MKKKNKRKIFRKLFKFTFTVGVIFIIGFAINYFIITSSVKLDTNKLTHALSTPSFSVLSTTGENINTNNKSKVISIEDLKTHTINAFLTSEDRSFYKHKGLDYKRIAGAMYNNIKSRKIKQGGSTISQQLIKNTHLSSDKTIERKLKEIKLTKELEKNYSKNKILELYLNTIYFGNGCYGIEEASQFYFSKSSSDISPAESAMLVGIISSPKYNEPIQHMERATAKKLTILSNMNKLGLLSDKDYISAKNQEIIITKHNNDFYNQFLNSTINSASKILGLTENQLRNKNIVIETSLNNNLNNFITNLINEKSYQPVNENQTKPIIQSIVIDNKTHKVIAYTTNAKYNQENTRRQPGSVIKPLLVYAPAFESGKITPSSFILDEQTNFGEYSPKNSNNKYLGWTNIRTAIEKSLNVPAVKTLSYIGTEKAKNFANRIGLKFDKNDNHLAIALGGLTNGTTIKEIADAYSSLANLGEYSPSSFITKIKTANNNLLYESKVKTNKAMKQETAYMITSCLMSAVKDGTAKKLSGFDFSIASKTGTTNNNKDAWNACYTTSHTIVTWYGNSDNSKLGLGVNGSTYPTLINKEILRELYKNNLPEDFEIPENIIQATLDSEDLNNNIISLSTSQEKSSQDNEIFTIDNLPKFTENKDKMQINLSIENKTNNKPKLIISCKNAENIVVYKENNNKIAVFKEIENPNSSIEIIDNQTRSGEIYSYYVAIKNGDKTITTDKIKIKSY